MVTLIGVSGSLRRGSFNASLLRAAVELLPEGAELTIATIRGMAPYGGGVEAAEGVPAPVTALKDAVAAADGLLWSRAQSVIAEDGTLADPKVRDALRSFLQGRVAFVEATKRARA